MYCCLEKIMYVFEKKNVKNVKKVKPEKKMSSSINHFIVFMFICFFLKKYLWLDIIVHICKKLKMQRYVKIPGTSLKSKKDFGFFRQYFLMTLFSRKKLFRHLCGQCNSRKNCTSIQSDQELHFMLKRSTLGYNIAPDQTAL